MYNDKWSDAIRLCSPEANFVATWEMSESVYGIFN
jgi:hypothetical protein